MPTIQVKENHIVLGVGTKNKTSIKKMRKVVLFCCALLCTTVLMAQQQLATLKHNDSISVFYGTNAFVQAYNAAADGDVITLSDGGFTPCDIYKSITVRGNGANPDTARGSFGTQFLSTLTVRENGVRGRFEAVGIYFPNLEFYAGTRKKIEKCIAYNFSTAYGETEAINCILNSADIYTDDTTTSMFFNCVVRMNSYLPDDISFTNCIVSGCSYYSRYSGEDYYYASQYYNCILIHENNNCAYNSFFVFGSGQNNILCGFSSFSGIYSQEHGNVVMNMSDLFETWNGDTLVFKDDAYVLKNSVSTTTLGLDGTQVGVYGGMAPLSLTPSYCIIKKCDVATRTNAEGKLSVDIEVVTE